MTFSGYEFSCHKKGCLADSEDESDIIEESPNEYNPSVLSYSLDGRKASHLPIPTYQCNGSWEVTAIITVNLPSTLFSVKITIDYFTNLIRKQLLEPTHRSEYIIVSHNIMIRLSYSHYGDSRVTNRLMSCQPALHL